MSSNRFYAYLKVGYVFPIVILLALSMGCDRSAQANEPLLYDTIPTSRMVVPIINEASGIADSKKNPGMIWVEEDSGNPTQLFLLGHDGAVKKSVFIKGVANRDWEDICLVDGKIYIGDIGDNNGVYPECYIYYFEEPGSTVDTVHTLQTIKFVYADGPRDAEAFLVDPVSKDIFLITKRDVPSRIYKISHPYSNSSVNTAMQVGVLKYSGVVSASLSPNGKQILLKTYTGIQQYDRSATQSIAEALSTNGVSIPYKIESQGEAIGFAIDNNGFFTLSEKGFATTVNLYFYRRK